MLLLSLIPVASLAASKRNDSPVNALASQSDLSMRRSRSVTVNDPETGERTVMTEEDYLCGIVAAQMPAEYDDEAIKAQAVASYTLMKYRGKNANQEAEQGFISVKEMKRTWNGDFKKNYTRLKALVHSVYGEYIAYEGQPILAAYHEFSCGRTEYGKNIWDGEFPYLVPVGSRDDICAENYRGSVRLTESEFKRICGKKLNVVPDGDPKKWVGECVRSDSGYVMRCSICGVSINGQKLRNAFALRSACLLHDKIRRKIIRIRRQRKRSRRGNEQIRRKPHGTQWEKLPRYSRVLLQRNINSKRLKTAAELQVDFNEALPLFNFFLLNSGKIRIVF